jgi:hypothetical protein
MSTVIDVFVCSANNPKHEQWFRQTLRHQSHVQCAARSFQHKPSFRRMCKRTLMTKVLLELLPLRHRSRSLPPLLRPALPPPLPPLPPRHRRPTLRAIRKPTHGGSASLVAQILTLQPTPLQTRATRRSACRNHQCSRMRQCPARLQSCQQMRNW